MENKISSTQAELLSNTFLNYAGALVVVLDHDGRIIQFNRASENLSGLTFDEVKGKFPWDTFLPPEDAESIRKNAFEILASNPQAMSGSYTNYWMIKDGERALIDWVNTVVLDDQKRMSYLISVGTDITERKLDEQKLKNSEQRLKEAQHIAKVGSWELNLVKNELLWSDEIFNIFEIDQTKFTASYDAFLDAIHPDDRDMVNKAYSDSLVDRSPYVITHRLKMNNGSIKYVRESCESSFDTNGKPVRSIGTVQDITELHIAEKELRQHRDHLEELVFERTSDMKAARDEAERANLAKSDFLSRMSHELRTPMNAILGFAQLLDLGGEALTDIQSLNVKEILDAGNHLLTLINEVLDLSIIESGKMEILIEEVPVNKLMQQCIAIIGSQAEARQLKIIDHVSSTGHRVQADVTRFKQVLLNLLSNAVKYNRDNGNITLTCKIIDRKRLRICIADTGEGLTEDNIANLFTSFERLNTTSNVEGVGIGLVITKHLIELMGGHIGVESTVGEGSVFWVELTLTNDVLGNQ